MDLRSGASLQFTACALLYLPLVAWLEGANVRWTPEFIFALAWLVLVLSVGAISLLYWLLRHDAASDVARLFYLVPPVTALLAWQTGVAYFAFETEAEHPTPLVTSASDSISAIASRQ